uniref:Uncharacterized protein n=1 Tax=Lactuca sativa TaxID=4236 RepID=A0A9R1WQL6_LACSA|nr:hypothetical protein LSAT_V11C900486350 [Lactuca sativa]
MFLKELEKGICHEFESNYIYIVWLVGNEIGINSKFCLADSKWNCNPCKMTELPPFLFVLFNFTLFSILHLSIRIGYGGRWWWWWWMGGNGGDNGGGGGGHGGWWW